jgi:hypothetical protein
MEDGRPRMSRSFLSLPASEPRKWLKSSEEVVVRLCSGGGDGGMQPCPVPIRKVVNGLDVLSSER